MKKNRPGYKVHLIWFGAYLFALAIIVPASAQGQAETEEFFDTDYGYAFTYPKGWNIRNLPEGKANPDLRVVLQGPNGGSFTVVVEKLGKPTNRDDFVSNPERKKVIEAMMSQTLERTYKIISQNMQAKSMKVGERADLSNEFGIKFYLTTLHEMAAGKPIVVAGIHAFPFGKDYSINFIMSAFWDPAATREQKVLTAIFNSFHLLGEKGADSSAKPGAPAERPEAR